MKRTAALILASTLAFACSDAGTDKGAEENPLTDGKSDSFFRPTEHGTLRWGLSNPGRLTDDEQFHAWTFELTGEATVDLVTEPSPNLDTVMYLYKRTSEDDSWGRYIKKNDDDGDSIASRIRLNGDAGEYRVIVKGFKTALRGGFGVMGECEGDGCTVGNGGSCAADSFETLPNMTQFTADCAFDIAGVLASTPRSASSGSVLLSEKCALSGLERQAIDFYHEWWDSLLGFDDYIAYGEEDVQLDFEVEELSGGTIITVGAGGDEDAISFYFDGDDNLRASYQHNQSPTIDYYCGEGGAPIEGPDESCFSDIRFALPHDEESDREFGEASNDEPSEHAGINAAVALFISEYGLDDDTLVTTETVSWTSDQDVNVVAVNILGPDDGTAEYTVFQEWDETWKVIMRADPNGVSFVCE